MQAICELKSFERDAAAAGMSRDEIDVLVDFVAGNPEAGEIIQGTGGCRKIRVAGRGRGKSGGYRVVIFFTGPDLPVFLLTVLGRERRTI